MTEAEPFVDDPERQCVGKFRWLTRSEARRHRKRHEARVHNGTMNVYECPHCGFWHVGHKRAPR